MEKEKQICMACENHSHLRCSGIYEDENDVVFVCDCDCQNK